MSRNVTTKKRKSTPPLGSEETIDTDNPTTLEEMSQVKRAKPMGLAGPASNGNDKQFVDSKLAELEEEIKLIKSGEHPELVEKMKQLEKKRKDDLARAEMLKSMRLQEVEALYEFAVQEANDVFNGKKKEMQDRLLLETEETVKRFREMKGEVAAKKRTGRGRSGSMGGDDEGSQEEEGDGTGSQDDQEDTAGAQTVGTKKSARNAQASERRNADKDIGLHFAAPSDAISDDLAKMHAEWMKRVEAYHSREEVSDLAIRVEDGRLYYNELIIEKGASVVVRSEVSEEDFYGIVTKISPTEVTIRLADGGNSRLLLAHLKSGRCKIARDGSKEGTSAGQ